MDNRFGLGRFLKLDVKTVPLLEGTGHQPIALSLMSSIDNLYLTILGNKLGLLAGSPFQHNTLKKLSFIYTCVFQMISKIFGNTLLLLLSEPRGYNISDNESQLTVT